MNDFSDELQEVELTAGAMAFFFWPLGASVDIITRYSIVSPAAAIAAFSYVLGDHRQIGNFAQFGKAYVAAGVTFAVVTWIERNVIAKRVQQEADKINLYLGDRAQAYGEKYAGKTLKQWCADNGNTIIGKMVCALNYSSIGVKSTN